MIRVLPRDAFNDANLLKCIGKLTMAFEDGELTQLAMSYDGEAFDIQQNPNDGSTYISNIEFMVNNDFIQFYRPMNSRDNWPLYADINDETLEVFNDDGTFTREFLQNVA